MRNIHSLDAIFPKTRQGILAATLVQPEKAWYVSELARRMGVPSSSLQRELRDLSETGILKTRRQGRMVYYQANTESQIFSELRGLMLKTAGRSCSSAEPCRRLGLPLLHPNPRSKRRACHGHRFCKDIRLSVRLFTNPAKNCQFKAKH